MHTVIVGGGVAGIKMARELSKRKLGKITLISKDTDFLYHRLLYDVVTGSDALDSLVSLEEIFTDDTNVTVVKGTLESLDVNKKEIICSAKTHKYDTLILALGASADYSTVSGAELSSFSIETLAKANELRHHIHDDLVTNHKLDEHYVIVGGGLTGVELAGTLGAYVSKIAAAHKIKKSLARILLVEKEDRLLPLCSRTASNKVIRRLKNLGVDVRFEHKVQSITSEHIVIDEEKIAAKTVIWTCGSRGNSFFRDYPDVFKLTEDDYIIVDDHLKAYDSLYVIGDSTALPYGGRVASTMREAVYLADYLDRMKNRKLAKPFRPVGTATCIPVGDKWAYVEKYGIYAAGVSGNALYRLHEKYVLNSLLPSVFADRIFYAQAKHLADCDLCDT